MPKARALKPVFAPFKAVPPPSDGYSWLKYGEKNMYSPLKLRSYFKCACHKTGCEARKTVDSLPPGTTRPRVASVGYINTHNHGPVPQPAAAAPSPTALSMNPCRDPTAGCPSTELPTTGLPTAGFHTAEYPTAGFHTPGFHTAGFPTAGSSTAGFHTAGFPTAGLPATGLPKGPLHEPAALPASQDWHKTQDLSGFLQSFGINPELLLLLMQEPLPMSLDVISEADGSQGHSATLAPVLCLNDAVMSGHTNHDVATASLSKRRRIRPPSQSSASDDNSFSIISDSDLRGALPAGLSLLYEDILLDTRIRLTEHKKRKGRISSDLQEIQEVGTPRTINRVDTEAFVWGEQKPALLFTPEPESAGPQGPHLLQPTQWEGGWQCTRQSDYDNHKFKELFEVVFPFMPSVGLT